MFQNISSDDINTQDGFEDVENSKKSQRKIWKGMFQKQNILLYIISIMVSSVNFSEEMICYNAAYLHEKYIERRNFEVKIKVLKEEFVEVVKNNYSELSLCNSGYIEERVKDKELYGAFLGNRLAGFIGTHEEGSIGMLEVMPEFRGKCIGSELERYAINRAISKGRYPYCQVKEKNEISMKLQKSLGMEISKTKVYWLFK